MAFKNATIGALSGVTVAAADIESNAVTNAKLAGSITSDKLSKPYGISYLVFEQATVAAVTGLGWTKLSQAGEILYVTGGLRQAGTAASTIVDVHVGGSRTSHHSIFGSGTKLKPGLTALNSVIAQPSGSLGQFSAGHYLRLDVDAVSSGTKSDLKVVVAVKHLLV